MKINKNDSVLFIRGEYVVLDSVMAEYFETETKVLNKAVKRNIERFPSSMMFQLTKEEFDSVRSQNGTSPDNKGGRRYLPYVFTEMGCWTLAMTLRSDKAVQKGLELMKTFEKVKKYLQTRQIDSPMAQKMLEAPTSIINVYQNVNISNVKNLQIGDGNKLKTSSKKEILGYLAKGKALLKDEGEKELVGQIQELTKAVRDGDKATAKDKLETINETVSLLEKVGPAVAYIQQILPSILGLF